MNKWGLSSDTILPTSFSDHCPILLLSDNLDCPLPNSSTGYVRRNNQKQHFLSNFSFSLQNHQDTNAGGRMGGSEPSLKRKRGVFHKDLQHMMYGFGDDPNPLPETIALMEDMVMEYVTDMVHKAQDIGSKRGKLLTEDFLFIIRKDLPKINRCKELLSMNEELKQARKAFDVDEEKLAQTD